MRLIDGDKLMDWEVLGINFYGTILFAGVSGDEFADLNPKAANLVRKMVE